MDNSTTNNFCVIFIPDFFATGGGGLLLLLTGCGSSAGTELRSNPNIRKLRLGLKLKVKMISR